MIFPALVSLALVFQPDGASAGICKFLGAISYAVYMLHAPLTGVLEGIYQAATHHAAGQYAPYAGVCFALLLVPICVVADKYYDFPLRKILSSFRTRSMT